MSTTVQGTASIVATVIKKTPKPSKHQGANALLRADPKIAPEANDSAQLDMLDPGAGDSARKKELLARRG